jgi:hypothetical protein
MFRCYTSHWPDVSFAYITMLCHIYMFTSLHVTILFMINRRWLYELFDKFLDMVYVYVELSIDMAVLCGAVGKHFIVPVGIRPHCGGVSCASACCPAPVCGYVYSVSHNHTDRCRAACTSTRHRTTMGTNSNWNWNPQHHQELPHQQTPQHRHTPHLRTYSVIHTAILNWL